MPHGMLDPYSLAVRRWRKAVYLLAVEQRSMRLARRTIFTTEEEARLAKLQPWPISRPVVIPLGADAPSGDRTQMARPFLDRFPGAKDRRLVLFLGRLHFKKGLDRVLDAWPHIVGSFPEATLVIAGDGETRYREEVKALVKSQGMGDSVLMTGRLDGALKWGAYAASTLFVLPSRQENFAITVAEAMQMGLPVIISDKVNTWPYVTQAAGGIVLKEDNLADELRSSVTRLLRDPGASEKMGSRARTFAREHLTWNAAGDALMRCYLDVLEEFAASGGYRAAHAA
jgi:glycosyltransferase involved in cell wall biosynthesis